MKKIGAVITIVVVLIVVVSGSLVLSGIIPLPNSNSNTTKSSTTSTTTSSSTVGNAKTLNSNVQQKAPNVVSSSVVNSSLGGKWSQKAGASGSTSNLSSASSITSFGLIGPNSSPYRADLSIAVRGIVDAQFNIVTPMTTSTQNFNPSNLTVKQFEANLYEPSGNGFAAIGYIQINNNSSSTYVYNYINSSAHTSYGYSSGSGQKIFLTNGNGYLYQWTQGEFGTNNILWNLSITIGLYGPNLIGIFYFTPDNLSLNHFTNLLNAEISKLSNPSTNLINNVFVNTSEVDNQTNMPFVQEASLLMGISNGTQMFNEFAKAYNLEQSIPTPTEHLLINYTVGNLTLIGLSAFTAGEYNYSSPEGYSGTIPILAIVGIANFSSSKIPSAIFLEFQGWEEMHHGTATNFSNGTITDGNLGSGQYIYGSGPAVTSYYYNGQSYVNTSFGNASLLISYEGSFLTVILYMGHYSLSKNAILKLLSDEYSDL